MTVHLLAESGKQIIQFPLIHPGLLKGIYDLQYVLCIARLVTVDLFKLLRALAHSQLRSCQTSSYQEFQILD